MAYRNGTYVAFAADGGKNILTSDIKYYNLLKGWHLMKARTFRFNNPHTRGTQLRGESLEQTIKRTLRARLNNSKRFILLVGNTTRFDDDYVPYEIKYAIDTCKLPIIIVYVNERNKIVKPIPQKLLKLLPKVLIDRINDGTAKTIHIPFRERIINEAIKDFDYSYMPPYTITVFTLTTYKRIYKQGEI